MKIDQDEIDAHYEEVKKTVERDIEDYAGSLKRINKSQKERLLLYAKMISFSTAEECNAYVQSLKTVGKRDKARFQNYLSSVQWLPEDAPMGFLDGQLVTRTLPESQEEKLLKEAFAPLEDPEEERKRVEARKARCRAYLQALYEPGPDDTVIPIEIIDDDTEQTDSDSDNNAEG